MTIGDLEQGLRNLIATNPLVISGSLGKAIQGALEVVESFRELSIKVQAYPVQDKLKSSLVDEVHKSEMTISKLMEDALAERGVNISLYTSYADLNVAKDSQPTGKMEFLGFKNSQINDVTKTDKAKISASQDKASGRDYLMELLKK